ncbi:hypothetical protein VP01_1250g10 [Puccinia sorghi]|uniref:NADP-dependent oxidoreductase domain-containing protein n=1 Tax=Puccinia sorghi TaxID=27349 RepID=A0A0L6VQX7_9BASI|nr:hypothetical protein VP01_1250g10 [Puccinia sorghi]
MSSSQKFQIKQMRFNRLGRSGLRVPIFSYGGWLTVGSVATGAAVKELMQIAWDHSEIEMGKAIKELGWAREEFMVATKVFFGTGNSEEPNGRGLSRKHIIEGAKASLARLQLSYVDVIHAHRPDPSVPMLETVRAFTYLIDKGFAFYWGTSEWSAHQIQEAFTVAEKYNLIPPTVEQPQYSLLHRERFEVEYDPIFKNLGYGSTIWSPLKSGILTGKYNEGVPSGSRMDVNKEFFKDSVARLQTEKGQEELKKVRELSKFAQDKLGCSVGQLALAWAASNPHVIDKLTPEIKKEIEAIVANAPTHPATYGR